MAARAAIAAEALRPADPPTDPIPIWTAPDGVRPETALAAIDLATRTGVALMATGAAAADVSATVLRLTGAYGLRSVHVDLTYNALTLSYHRGPEREPVTVMRVVRGRTQDFTRQQRLLDVVDVIVREMMPPSEARESVDAVIRAPHPYRRWVVATGVGFMGAGSAVLAGGGLTIIVLSLLSAAAVSWTLYRLSRSGMPAFFAQAVGSAIPTVFAAALAAVQGGTGLFAQVLPSLIVASGIVVLLAGFSLVGAAQDAIDGYYVTAVARLFQVFALTLGIVVGIVVVLALAHQLGIVLTISSESLVTAGPLTQVASAGISAGAFAISAYTAVRSSLVAALAAAAGWVVQVVAVDHGATPAFSAAMAALVIGLAAQLAAHRMRISALAVTTASIVPLLPGRATYRGIFEIVSDANGPGLFQGAGTLLGALGIGVGLAAGVSLGTSLGRLVQRGLHRGDPVAG